MRKIEYDDAGNIVHVYEIRGDYDPHNPMGGLVVSDEHAELHQKFIDHLPVMRAAYRVREGRIEKRDDSEAKERLAAVSDQEIARCTGKARGGDGFVDFDAIPEGFTRRKA